MGVYIKGMEMPTKCAECRLSTVHGFHDRPLCDVLVEYMSYGEWEAKRLNNCPLVSIPPHGRLIDADALENKVQMRLLECNKYDNQFQKPYEVMRAIALAPTIISAEEE